RGGGGGARHGAASLAPPADSRRRRSGGPSQQSRLAGGVQRIGGGGSADGGAKPSTQPDIVADAHWRLRRNRDRETSGREHPRTGNAACAIRRRATALQPGAVASRT